MVTPFFVDGHADAATHLLARAAELRTEKGRIKGQWHKNDAEMVAGELERMADRIVRLSAAYRRSGWRR